jgi:hypothetical protein
MLRGLVKDFLELNQPLEGDLKSPASVRRQRYAPDVLSWERMLSNAFFSKEVSFFLFSSNFFIASRYVQYVLKR